MFYFLRISGNVRFRILENVYEHLESLIMSNTKHLCIFLKTKVLKNVLYLDFSPTFEGLEHTCLARHVIRFLKSW